MAVWTDLAASAPRPGAGAVELGACALEPSLMVLPPGSAIAVTNPSTGEREVRLSLIGAAPDAPPFASRSLKAGAVAGLKAPAQGRADLSCTGEPCEGALVVAAIGGLTDRAGAATLRGVKPGSAVVHAWHPALGETEASVEVVAGAVAELTLHLKAASVAP